jgi:hypothetical protein
VLACETKTNNKFCRHVCCVHTERNEESTWRRADKTNEGFGFGLCKRIKGGEERERGASNTTHGNMVWDDD